MNTPQQQLQSSIPPNAKIVDHPTARTRDEWRDVQRQYEAEGYETGLVLSPRTGEVLLWRRTEVA